MRVGESKPAKLAVALASYNRKEKTLACIQAVSSQAHALPGVGESLHIVLVDDGSTDGTADAVAAAFPYVQMIRGNGSLFWCRSMHIAQAAAMSRGCEYLLWLNDDTDLAPDALKRAFECADSLKLTGKDPCVVIGSMCDPSTGNVTYGGMVRNFWWQRTNLLIVSPRNEPQCVLTMNGNFVLIPSEILNVVGNLDSRYQHAMGDLDYGLRIIEAGYDIWVMPGFAGYCRRNSIINTFNDKALSLKQRWKNILSPKGLPVRSWAIFTKKHAGILWPLYFLWPYVRVVVSSLISVNIIKNG